ncbi:hypothetical protein N172_01090 [Pantoea dispersa EGD-AAK13]|nr:hypothetical protein N172_01090 [Pantoea dispersa EGD-AAK13]KAF0854771.1 hypothetical protein Y788_15165 [Pantoea dispersa 625]
MGELHLQEYLIHFMCGFDQFVTGSESPYGECGI